jgi:hypothetical protein
MPLEATGNARGRRRTVATVGCLRRDFARSACSVSGSAREAAMGSSQGGPALMSPRFRLIGDGDGGPGASESPNSANRGPGTTKY